MTKEKVIIAGGGIGGLTLALTLHQIGVPFLVLESSQEMRPLGVGINLQPNAVRELFDLGFDASILDTIGVPSREWALVGLNGREVYAESRGLEAGYRWPQYAVHRGKLHMLLHQTLLDVRDIVLRGELDLAVVEQAAMSQLRDVGFEPQYLSVRRCADLGLPESEHDERVVLAAAMLGTTHLIDNVRVSVT